MSAAKERPILFSGPMVRALLAGRKTQTRRIVKPQPPASAVDAGHIRSGDPASNGVWLWLDSRDLMDASAIGEGFRCPYGVAGDRLWGRETWCESDTPSGFAYAADYAHDTRGYGWRPSIHMPRAAARLTLAITDVRVERLQDISEADAIAEGLYRSTPTDADLDWFRSHHEEQYLEPPSQAQVEDFAKGVWMVPGVPQGWGLTVAERARDTWAPTPQFGYRLLWNHINGPDSWDANPWVWALTFEVVS